MAKNLQELGQKLQDLASHSLEEQVRAFQRYSEFVQKFGREDLFKNPVQDGYWRFFGEAPMQYMSTLASLHLNYYEALMELGRTFNEKLFKQMAGAAAGASDVAAASARAASVAAAPRRVEIELRGTVGEELVRSLVLENKYQVGADVYFLISDFVGPEGTAPFRPNLEFQPARFTLRPGEERIITLRLQLTSPPFAAGSRYTATVVVRGYDDMELGISVYPTDPAAPAGGGAAPPPIGASS